jgi:hypothetical protein
MGERQRRISDIIPKIEPELEGEGERARRFVLNAEVRFLQPANMTGFALDASETGMRVVLDAPLAVGARCIAVVQLASGPTHERVEVVWTRRSPRGWEVGFKFAS